MNQKFEPGTLVGIHPAWEEEWNRGVVMAWNPAKQIVRILPFNGAGTCRLTGSGWPNYLDVPEARVTFGFAAPAMPAAASPERR